MEINLETGRKGVIICGPAASGKSRLAREIIDANGGVWSVLNEADLMKRFSVLNYLNGGELVLIDDAQFKPGHLSGIKMLCDGDYIRVERKGESEPRTIEAKFRVIITTNVPVEEIDEYVRRRFVIIVL